MQNTSTSMQNNEIRSWKGDIIGYRCRGCGEVVEKLENNLCPGCFRDEELRKALIRNFNDANSIKT